MNSISIKGFKRENIGKQSSKRLRYKANVPCILYGDNKEVVHFFIPMAYLKKIVYTSKVYFINIEIDNKTYKTILQSVQFHPVSELVLHMDFLQIFEDKPVKIMIPITFIGESPGVAKGGLLTKKVRKIMIKGLPKDIPSSIPVDVSNLDLDDSIKIKDLDFKNYESMMSKYISIAGVIVPRALKSKGSSEGGESEPVGEKNNKKQ